jgi:hypothetical protein
MEEAMKPSKEACEMACECLEDQEHYEFSPVVKYLRSLHEPCSTCGTVGGGGRVPCGMATERDGRIECCGLVPVVCPDDADADCTVPCDDCGDGGEG